MPDPAPISRRRTLARPRRVNRALSAWDESDAMALLPPSLRGDPRRWPTVPNLDREQLKSLRAELGEALGEAGAGEGPG